MIGITLLERMTQLSEEHGSLRSAAKAVGVDVGYLSRLASGEKVAPTKAILTKLGVRRIVTYELLAAPSRDRTDPLPQSPAKTTVPGDLREAVGQVVAVYPGPPDTDVDLFKPLPVGTVLYVHPVKTQGHPKPVQSRSLSSTRGIDE